MEHGQKMEQFNFAQLLRMPFQALVSELHTQLAVGGYPDIPAAHTIVFALVDKQGIRLTEFAKRAQLTKQMVNYLVTAVEERGYVERVPDPGDGRAKIVRLTERGQQAALVGSEIIEGIEREWANALGQEDMDELRDLLERLIGFIKGE
ncbi:MAG TPA: MarR family winged helix-turn-helix transcriptional regulator [Ktedonobacteraceae bacterium]|nr:MarR family winged helix-turn-helix transcriptional regulator [Ktedonobacteraceae bacterium]